jgi:arginase
MTRSIALIGVPSSAGAHWPGQEKAPQCLREAGLVQHLIAANIDVTDYGDLPRVRWQPDPQRRRPHHRDDVLEVARSLAERVEAVLQAQQIPLVIGGDCTITLGVLSGFLRYNDDIALLYLDGGGDLGTPLADPTDDFESMSLADILAASATTKELFSLGPRVPLISEEQIVLFGYTSNHQGFEHEILDRAAMPRYPADQVRGSPRVAAGKALAEIEGTASRFFVHFDVNVIDFVDFPVADVPQSNAGLTFQEAMDCLSVFAASPQFGGLVVTEFNPDHADEEGKLAATFVEHLAQALCAIGSADRM